MSVLLAIGSALTFGIADFLGGSSTRRATALTVVVGTQAVGLCSLVLVSPVLPAATYDGRDLWIGAVAGVCGALGLLQFFQAMAEGAMSVVAPVSAVVTGAVPVMAGVVQGERPSALAWVGIAIGLPAVAMISRESTERLDRASRTVLVRAALAGVGFGTFYVLADQTGEGSGIVPLIAARSTSVLCFGVLGVVGRRFAPPPRAVLATIALSGVLDVTGNVFFLYSVREGLLAIGSVISAMYPASTIVLARVVLGERLRRIQVVGLAAAATAVAVVALA